MGEAKQLFQKDKDKRDSLAAIVGSDWFKTALAFAKSELMDDAGVDSAQLAGARKFESILLSLPVVDEPAAEFPGPGLHHQAPVSESRKPKQLTEQ